MERKEKTQESEGEKRYFWSCACLSRCLVNTSIDHFIVVLILAPWQLTASLFCIFDAENENNFPPSPGHNTSHRVCLNKQINPEVSNTAD